MALVRIAGVTLPQQKRIDAALPYIFGVGWPAARRILAATKVDPSTRTSELTEADVAKIREFIEKNYSVEGNLRQTVAGNIKMKKEMGTTGGTPPSRGLPVRARRAKTISPTRHGNTRKTAGSGRKGG